ncbi:unnamed protein product [Lymnaea stagnalis]|uniref:PH domain-containing protein n=1 Tax=Lymnaea stagnalis TaxID=6523 RepID=A0AAV2H8H3_LYMST
MDKIEEILPGIEEFLTVTLASEPLTPFAEERRQFFIECLDIVKLPPTVPPREGRKLSPELLKATEETSGIPSTDFAATQREISRSLADPIPGAHQDEASEKEEDDSSQEGIKVYDDIDPTDSTPDDDTTRTRSQSNAIRPSQNSDEDEEEDEEDENDLYEIPVARLQLSAEENSLSYGADCSSLATAGSIEELPEDMVDFGAPPPLPLNPPPNAPPLPPRKDFKFSDFGSKSSLNEEKPPELPFRPPLPKRNELYATGTRSEKSDRSGDRSDPELSGDGDSTSYESFDEEQQDTELRSKLNIKLPKKPKKRGLKKSKKLSKSRSSSQWEISVPFRKLENVQISGELYHRGKLSWNRRLVAISNSCLAMYKPDKDARPSLVIPLSGFDAIVIEREGRRGFEIKMSHANQDSHTFSVDFREWANLWVEQINGISKGLPPPRYDTHLARSFTANTEYGVAGVPYGSRPSDTSGNSDNLDYDEIEPCDFGDLFIEEENDSESTCTSSSPSQMSADQSRRAKTLLSRHFRSEKSPSSKGRSLDTRARPFSSSYREKTIGATMKDILRRRQRGMYQVQGPEAPQQALQVTQQGLLTSVQVKPFTTPAKPSTSPAKPSTPPAKPMPPPLFSSAAQLSMARWDWKSVFYNWAMPLDQIILAFRGTDLAGSNSNLSTGSEGTSEDSGKPRMRGNKVMRMGSFAFRATQFFENIGKKSTKPHKKNHHSPASSGDYGDMHNGIIEESSFSSSTSLGNLSPSVLTPTSDNSMPNVFNESYSYSSSAPTTPIDRHPPLDKHGHGFDEVEEELFADIVHKGYLFIYSSFNRRKWGKRWCLVRDNVFECYRTDHSNKCELNFLLKPCVVRRAISETNSEHGLMILEGGKEKITVEPENKDEMKVWVRVLLAETSTPAVPEGLEEYMKDLDSHSQLSFTVLKQWDMIPSKDACSSTEYEDPLDTTLTAKQFQTMSGDEGAQSQTEAPPSDGACSNQTDSAIDGDNTTSAAEGGSNGDGKFSQISDNLESYNKNKHTTDSGFYSVKEANSDSEGEHSARRVDDLDCGYATLDSRSYMSTQEAADSLSRLSGDPSLCCSKNPSNKSSVHCCGENNQSVILSDSSVEKSQDHSTTGSRLSSSSSQSHHSSSSTLTMQEHNWSSIHSTSSSTCSTSSSARSTANSKHCDTSSSLHRSGTCSPKLRPSYPERPKHLTHSSENMRVSASGSATIVSLSGDEYSIVVRKSKSKSPERNTQKINNGEASQAESDKKPSDEEAPALPTSTPLLESSLSSQGLLPNSMNLSQTTLETQSSEIQSKTLHNDKEISLAPEDKKEAGHGLSVPQTPPKAAKRNINKVLPIQLEDRNSHCNGVLNSKEHSPSPGNNSSSAESPLTPTTEDITTLIENPNTTADELTTVLDRLRDKLLKIKKKRMAVHEKRQKVLSDEERLACEKEFAALEKAAENTDLDIRVLQNQLDTLQGQTLEAMKAAQGKSKSWSRRKKGKRKT